VAKRPRHRQLRYRIYRGPFEAWPSIAPGELLLEYFSDEELIGWRALAKQLQDYHYLWYFDLEGQRAAHQTQLVAALTSVAGTTIDISGWGRAIVYKYSHMPFLALGA
jgi:hypothetical protein